MKKKKEKRGTKKAFVKNRRIFFGFSAVLAAVSIVGFLDIVLKSFFQISFSEYIDFIWLVFMGIGFILIAKPNTLVKRKTEPIAELTALVIGILAIIAGVLSIPILKIDHPVFIAMKGVISLIAIIFIILETWLRKV
jgi:hypothetical protein